MRLLVPAAFALLSLAPAARAQECGMSPDFYQRRFHVADVDAAPVRQALDQGDLEKVAELARARIEVTAIDRDLRNGTWDPAGFGEDDIRAALAIAVVRTAGAEGPRAPTSKPAQKKKNLAWAERVLRRAFDAHAGDPVFATYLAEAAVAVGKNDNARAMLEDLAAADLIVSPEAWAALARLRHDDAVAAQQARSRCQAVARDPSICAAPADPLARS